jgi:hypothetical protein
MSTIFELSSLVGLTEQCPAIADLVDVDEARRRLAAALAADELARRVGQRMRGATLDQLRAIETLLGGEPTPTAEPDEPIRAGCSG